MRNKKLNEPLLNKIRFLYVKNGISIAKLRWIFDLSRTQLNDYLVEIMAEG